MFSIWTRFFRSCGHLSLIQWLRRERLCLLELLLARRSTDELTVDDLTDLAGYSQPLLRSQDRLSQELRPSCLPQLRAPMRHREIREKTIIASPSLGQQRSPP